MTASLQHICSKEETVSRNDLKWYIWLGLYFVEILLKVVNRLTKCTEGIWFYGRSHGYILAMQIVIDGWAEYIFYLLSKHRNCLNCWVYVSHQGKLYSACSDKMHQFSTTCLSVLGELILEEGQCTICSVIQMWLQPTFLCIWWHQGKLYVALILQVDYTDLWLHICFWFS